MTALHPNMVREAVTKAKIQKKDLAERAGIVPQSLSGIESEDWNPRWKTLEALCTAADEIKRERA